MFTAPTADKTILIVDDDPMIRRILRKILMRGSYNVIEASNGRDGLQALRDHTINLVISDVLMPHLTGMELLREIRSRHSSLPVILITGGRDVDTAIECMKIGASDYITKPFKVSKIEDTVCAALRKAEAADCSENETLILTDRRNSLDGFEIIRTLGEGSMGIVFLAKRSDCNDDTRYALKMFKNWSSCGSSAEDLKQRFLQEAEAAAAIDHPNIVKMVEYRLERSFEDNYILMEYIDGQPLHELQKSKALDRLSKTQIIHRLADALSTIHARDIYHRDIKPGNILITDKLLPKITDFGVARLPNSTITKATELIGSPRYMAPEAFTSPVVDQRADIFSLGVVAYEFFLGTHPYQADNFSRLCHAIQNEDPIWPSEVDRDFPETLDSILRRMMQRDPDKRYASADELRNDLETWIAESGESPLPMSA